MTDTDVMSHLEDEFAKWIEKMKDQYENFDHFLGEQDPTISLIPPTPEDFDSRIPTWTRKTDEL